MPPNETTLLEDIETNRRTPAFASFRAFLDHQSPGAAAASERFYRMVDGDFSDHFSDKLSECRQRAWFIRNSETGAVRIAAKQCRLRWCYHCSEARQQFITNAVYPWYSMAKSPKLLTVTLKHTKKPLTDQIDFLYKCFAKFRNRKLLKDNIRGGIWFFQVTYNQKTEEWHPHIHALLDADYMLHATLIHHWLKITGDSTIVHIRAVHDPEKTLSHNARYAARPSALVNLPESLWMDLYESFNGRRICGTWGSARKISLRPKKPDDAGKWEHVGGFKTVSRLVEFDDNASAIWIAWVLHQPLNPEIDMSHIEGEYDTPEIDERPPPDWVTEPYFDYVEN